jgi:zinc and cadmium transporter
MDTLLWIVAFTTLAGVLGVLAAAPLLLVPGHVASRVLGPLVSFAIGALLGAALLALLPHALESPGVEGAHTILISVLLGLVAFFVLEKLLIWRHCHHDECEVHGHAHESAVERAQRRATASLILIGDGIHNLVDGMLIAAAFLTSVELGVVTSIAVIAHEIPQEIGDFIVLLNSGYSRARALVFNVATSFTAVVGGVVAYFSLATAQGAVPYVLAIAAASFLYVAVADLIPGLHRRPEPSATVQQITLIVLGVVVIYITHAAMH